MKRRPYPKYKPSGVEWLGDVPESWKILRTKALEKNSSTVVQTGPFGAQLHAGDYVDEGIPLILIRNVGDMNIDASNIPLISQEDAARLSMYRLREGDIVFSRVGSIGRIALCTNKEDGWLISGQMLRLRITNQNLDKKFAAYAFGCSSILTFTELQSVGSTRESINTEILRNMPLPLPPLPEQQAITNFLDRETGRIDTLIGKKQRLIELLKEKRTALISHAVTKGLDPTTPMKPSGVEWLGDVPEHWGIKKIRRVATRVQTGSTPPTSEDKYYEDGTIAWFGPSSFEESIFLSEPVKTVNKCAIEDGAARLFSSGTVMIVGIGATIGKVSSIKEDASCNQQITGVTFKNSFVNAQYITYQLKQLETTIREIAPSATLAIFDQNKVSDLWVTLPPIVEQQAIAEFLDRETAKIDALIAGVETAIKKLKEYRTALISAAVTGKIDLREAV
jgi:type I restriction enzyme, S subunit